MTRAFPTASPPGGKRTYALALGWGFAEATVFFIVPDVLLTRLALRDARRAGIACVWSLAGALAGGVCLWMIAESGGALWLLRAFESLPGIDRTLSFTAASSLNENGTVAFFTGALTGVPYKLFAVHAHMQGMSLAVFVAVSGAARFFRFGATTLLAWLVGRVLHNVSPGTRLRLHTAFWFVFYVSYFALVTRG